MADRFQQAGVYHSRRFVTLADVAAGVILAIAEVTEQGADKTRTPVS